MNVPNATFTERSWRVHEFTQDFELEDVWALPTPGGPGDLDRLVQQISGNADEERDVKPSWIYRILFAIRLRIGGLLGMDQGTSGVGERVGSLRERLPADLRDGLRGPDIQGTPLTSVYQTDDEWVAEFANSTAHAILHIGWVEDGHAGCHGQMAVLVKPNGLFGKLYMRFIDPFRRWFILPSLVRTIGQQWRTPPST
ncbi:DUF2867 domain-containing protein [Streptomyces sp. NPDC059193]|uniref:DUF2867 domain-containing protein n=1 Tax=Streptomyces sp. NPDC059193 TaxID=3346763 RepID=UPI0036CD1F7A